MKTLFLCMVAAVFLAATSRQASAQDDLDSLSKSLKATPTPTTTAPPRTATATPTSHTTAAATPRPSTATTPAAPRETVREQLAHGRFVEASDLASMAGKKVSAGTFLVGTFKASGNKAGGRTEFDGGGGLFGGGGTVHVFVKFPVVPDPRLTAPGYSSRWAKEAPLRLERVENTPRGLTAWTIDVTP